MTTKWSDFKESKNKTKVFTGTWLDRPGKCYDYLFTELEYRLRIVVHTWLDTNEVEVRLVDGDGRTYDFKEHKKIILQNPTEVQLRAAILELAKFGDILSKELLSIDELKQKGFSYIREFNNTDIGVYECNGEYTLEYYNVAGYENQVLFKGTFEKLNETFMKWIDDEEEIPQLAFKRKFYIIDEYMTMCYPNEVSQRAKDYGVLQQYIGKQYPQSEVDEIICEMVKKHPYIDNSMNIRVSIFKIETEKFHRVRSYYHTLDFRNDDYKSQTKGETNIKYAK